MSLQEKAWVDSRPLDSSSLDRLWLSISRTYRYPSRTAQPDCWPSIRRLLELRNAASLQLTCTIRMTYHGSRYCESMAVTHGSMTARVTLTCMI